MKAVEVLLFRYDRTVSANPNKGDAIWGKMIARDEVEKKKKAIYRLEKIVKASDPESHTLVMGDILEIHREKKGAAFNAKGEVVFYKNISGTDTVKKLHQKAGQRLVKYLTRVDREYNYYSRIEWLDSGRYGYQVAFRHTEVLGNSDKEVTIKRLITGRKAAISRNINKAKAVREEYRKSLFPEAYTTDQRYVKLLRNIPLQKKRLHDAKKMVPDDIEDVVGSLQDVTRPSLKNLIKKMVA